MTNSDSQIAVMLCNRDSIYWNGQVNKLSNKNLKFDFLSDYKSFYFKMWYLTHENEIRFENKCLDITTDTISNGYTKVMLSNCIDNFNARLWRLTDNGQIMHSSTGLCLHMLEDYSDVRMQSCDQTNNLQLWDWNIK